MIRLNPQRRTVLTFAKRGHFFKTDKCHKLQLRSNCQNILGLSNIVSNTVKKNNVENTEGGGVKEHRVVNQEDNMYSSRGFD